MNRAERTRILEGVAKVSSIFRNMSVTSKEIRLGEAYPQRLRDAFTGVAKGHPLPNTAGVNLEWQLHPELGELCRAAIDISETLKAIGADDILESGPDDLKRIVANPASYTPPKVRGPRYGFPLSD